jgi:protein-disulfide isomerase
MSMSMRAVWPWLLTAVALVFIAGFGAARLRAGAASEQVADTRPISDLARYKVPVSMSQPWRGSESALVTVVEWCDLGGEACRASDAIVAELLVKYDGQLRHVWRHLPVEASQDSMLAHELARIAHEQAGKFWEVRAALLERSAPLTPASMERYAEAVGLSLPAVRSAFERHSHAGYVAADGLFASKFGVSEAPALFVNGRRLLGAPTRERLVRLIEEELGVASKLEASGVPRGQLYDEITSDGLWDVPGSPLAKVP